MENHYVIRVKLKEGEIKVSGTDMPTVSAEFDRIFSMITSKGKKLTQPSIETPQNKKKPKKD